MDMETFCCDKTTCSERRPKEVFPTAPALSASTSENAATIVRDDNL